MYARRASALAVGVDGDDDLARLLQVAHLVGDPGRSASITETATPWTSGRLRASSRSRIWPSGCPSFRLSSTWAPNSSPPSRIPFSTAFHQSALLFVMNSSRGPDPPFAGPPAPRSPASPDRTSRRSRPDHDRRNAETPGPADCPRPIHVPRPPSTRPGSEHPRMANDEGAIGPGSRRPDRPGPILTRPVAGGTLPRRCSSLENHACPTDHHVAASRARESGGPGSRRGRDALERPGLRRRGDRATRNSSP